MEFTSMLQRLWRLRLLVAVGILLAAAGAIVSTHQVTLSPFAIKSKTTSFGAASVTFYLDTGRSTVSQSSGDVSGLIARAQVAARFIDSGEIRGSAARRLDVPTSAITVEGPTAENAGSQDQPAAQQRANAILGQASSYSVLVDTSASAPTVTLYTQAPTGREAVGLARYIVSGLDEELENRRSEERRGAEKALKDDLRAIASQEERTISNAERRSRERAIDDRLVFLRSLGSPVGGDVRDSSGQLLTVGLFVGFSLAWCVLLLLVSGAVLAVRRRD